MRALEVDILQLFGAYGFPALVAGFVLLRLEPAIKSLERTVTVNTIILAKISGVDYDEAKRMVRNGEADWR